MTNYTIGVDISKAFLDVHLLPDGKERQFSNDQRGFRTLIQWIGKRKIARAVFEPTGAYHRAFEDALSKAAIPLSKINPLQARRFAEARGTRAKNRRGPEAPRASLLHRGRLGRNHHRRDLDAAADVGDQLR